MKKGWNKIKAIDGFWQCSNMNCVSDAKYYRSDIDKPNGKKILYEFACTRHAVTTKKKR